LGTAAKEVSNSFTLPFEGCFTSKDIYLDKPRTHSSGDPDGFLAVSESVSCDLA